MQLRERESPAVRPVPCIFCCFTSSTRSNLVERRFGLKLEAKDNVRVSMSCLFKHAVGLSFTVASWEIEGMCGGLIFLPNFVFLCICEQNPESTHIICVCVFSSMSIHRPGEQITGRFMAAITARVVITSIAASECVAVFLVCGFARVQATPSD